METLRFLLTSSFYPPYHVGGACLHVKHLAQELAKRGHEVHIIHSLDAYRIKRGKTPPLRQTNETYQGRIHVHAIESHFKIVDPLIAYTSGKSSRIQREFEEIVRTVHPDVVHHHNTSLLGYSVLGRVSQYLCLYTAHDYWLICPTCDLLRNRKELCRKKTCFSCAIAHMRPPQVWRRVARDSFRAAVDSIDLIVSPSEYMRKRLLSEVDQKIITLPNFVPSPPSQIEETERSNYFLFVGMLEAHKGIMKLLRVFEEIQHIRDCGLVIVGEGSLRRQVRRFIDKNSLANRVWYEGFVDDARLYSLYENALALIVPSVWPENAPLVALEALSVGTPVIGANSGGLPEIVGKVDRRLLFGDWEGLRNILVGFSGQHFPRSTARRVYETNFSPSKYVDEYLRVIRTWDDMW